VAIVKYGRALTASHCRGWLTRSLPADAPRQTGELDRATALSARLSARHDPSGLTDQPGVEERAIGLVTARASKLQPVRVGSLATHCLFVVLKC